MDFETVGELNRLCWIRQGKQLCLALAVAAGILILLLLWK